MVNLQRVMSYMPLLKSHIFMYFSSRNILLLEGEASSLLKTETLTSLDLSSAYLLLLFSHCTLMFIEESRFALWSWLDFFHIYMSRYIYIYYLYINNLYI